MRWWQSLFCLHLHLRLLYFQKLLFLHFNGYISVNWPLFCLVSNLNVIFTRDRNHPANVHFYFRWIKKIYYCIFHSIKLRAFLCKPTVLKSIHIAVDAAAPNPWISFIQFARTRTLFQIFDTRSIVIKIIYTWYHIYSYVYNRLFIGL